MSREKEGYRDQLEALITFYGSDRMVSQQQVADYAGKSRRWVKDNLGIGRYGVTLPILARKLLEVCGNE